MKDSEFLQWIHDRLHFVHGENELYDYMWRLREIIKKNQEQEQELEDGLSRMRQRMDKSTKEFYEREQARL
jgi:hypothetical protein